MQGDMRRSRAMMHVPGVKLQNHHSHRDQPIVPTLAQTRGHFLFLVDPFLSSRGVILPHHARHYARMWSARQLLQAKE